MTQVTDVQRKNFLLVEGRLIADGGQSQITGTEWLYLYDQAKDDLVGVQEKILAQLAVEIHRREKKFSMDNAAL